MPCANTAVIDGRDLNQDRSGDAFETVAAAGVVAINVVAGGSSGWEPFCFG